ncbi:MAG: YaiO family outer membrane beta-barrel protein [Burkholderiaceae bacterium]|nr:YaiO family outer membrane beta-barrel protein [Burkholderiaceae bacterium]
MPLPLILIFSGVLLGSSLSATAQTDKTKQPFTVELSFDHQTLSNQSPSFQETALRLNRWLGPRHVIDFSLVNSQRFGLRDKQLLASYVHPVNDKLGIAIDAGFSPSQNFLPHHSLDLRLQYEFAPAWVAYAGLKNSQYKTLSVRQGLLMVERYIGPFSFALSWHPVQALGKSTSNQVLKAYYYYGQDNMLGLIYSRGQEATQINDALITLADVRSLTLSGRYWIAPEWAVNYSVGSTQQGSFYTRKGVRFGIQHSF